MLRLRYGDLRYVTGKEGATDRTTIGVALMMDDIPKFTDTQYLIIQEIIRHFDRLGAEFGIFVALGSWGDTLPDEEILQMLKEI